MKAKKIDHIAIVVKRIEDYLPVYTEILGMRVLRTEDMPIYKSKICFLQCGDVLLELLEPYGPCINMTMLEEKEGGFSHICYEVEDIEACYNEMKERNISMFEAIPDIVEGVGNSRVFFTQPDPLGNIMAEFVEHPK